MRRIRARALVVLLAVGALLAGCGSAAAPPVIPTATADATPTPSPVVTAPRTPVVTPSPTPDATPAAECPSDPRPSTLAVLDTAARLACFGSTSLTFGAVVVPGSGMPVPDGAPLPVPERFRQVSLPEYGPLFLVDWGTEVDSGTSLRLYVANLSRIDWDFVVNNRVVTTDPPPSPMLGGGLTVTGHFDDPASADCRGRPVVDEAGNGPFTDEQVIQWCRGTFIVTRIWDPSG